MKEEKHRVPENWFEIAYNNSIWQTQEASWDEVYRVLEENRIKSHSILIRVNEESFAKPDLTLASLEVHPIGNLEMRFKLFDDERVYSTEIPALIETKLIRVHAQYAGFGLIQLSKCIKDGGRGDEEGFDVEPDTWIEAYCNQDGKLVAPFTLDECLSIKSIKGWLKAGINPIDSEGKIKVFPFSSR